MSLRRRAALALAGGFALAGALPAPAVGAEEAPVASVACVDRVVATLSSAEDGLGLTVAPLVTIGPDGLPSAPPPPVNPAVAVVTVENGGGTPTEFLVTRDADVAVPILVGPGATTQAAFEVTEHGASTFRVADAEGHELALVTSTADCTPPPGWCDAVRAAGGPVAADGADICPVPGEGTFAVPDGVDEPVPTGRMITGEEVLGQAAQATSDGVPYMPHDAIGVPAPQPPHPEEVARGEITPEEYAAGQAAAQAAAAQQAAEPQLAASGSRSRSLAQMAALLLGTGVAVTSLGRRRVDVELDDRAVDAMARIRAAATPPRSD